MRRKKAIRGEDRTNETRRKEIPKTKGKRLSVFLSPPSSFVSSNPRLSPENRRVFAMSSHPFRVRTRNTRINMKFHRRNTAALSLSLFRGEGRKEGRSRATPVVALHSRRREGKNPLVYQESSGRNGDRGGKREREREGRKESRLLVSDFAFASRAIDRRNIYFDSRFVSFNPSPSCIWRI